jgi:hypothetical protein
MLFPDPVRHRGMVERLAKKMHVDNGRRHPLDIAPLPQPRRRAHTLVSNPLFLMQAGTQAFFAPPEAGVSNV